MALHGQAISMFLVQDFFGHMTCHPFSAKLRILATMIPLNEMQIIFNAEPNPFQEVPVRLLSRDLNVYYVVRNDSMHFNIKLTM